MRHGITRDEFVARRRARAANPPFHELDAYTDDEVRDAWRRILADADARDIDANMERRGHLLRAGDSPEASTSRDLWLPALVGGGLLLAALAISLIVGGGA